MKKAIWLSYDLGIRGDYRGLYTFLDNLDAKECGDGVAFFKYEIDRNEDLIKKIKEDIKKNMSINVNDRIYIIYKEGDKVKGKFIFGKRKSPPWTGYGTKSNIEDSDLSIW